MSTAPGNFFSWDEFEESSTAERLKLDNTAPPQARRAIVHLVETVLDPLREALGRPVRITSGFRSAALNAAIKGSATSQHMKGEAADIKVEGMGAEAIARAIVDLGVEFDQVIWYDPVRGGHVHVSCKAFGHNRRQTLWAPSGGGYVPWRR
jgi:zinc D-Ala-D-Ala carboxypeptidase